MTNHFYNNQKNIITKILNNTMSKAMTAKQTKTIMDISDEFAEIHMSAQDSTKHYCCAVPEGGGKRQWEKGGYR